MTAVISLPLWASVAIVIAFDGEGWRFFDWLDGSGQPLGAEPSSEDRARRFDSPASALAFFRARYIGSQRRRGPVSAGGDGDAASTLDSHRGSAPAARPAAHAATCVLIIDDSDDDATQMQRRLYKGGLLADCVRVDTAETIAAALADERGWEIIICDYRIPRLDAAQVLHTVRSALPGRPHPIGMRPLPVRPVARAGQRRGQ